LGRPTWRAGEPFLFDPFHLHNNPVLHDYRDAAEAQAAQGVEDLLQGQIMVGTFARRAGGRRGVHRCNSPVASLDNSVAVTNADSQQGKASLNV
jgi:hypothetical protein